MTGTGNVVKTCELHNKSGDTLVCSNLIIQPMQTMSVDLAKIQFKRILDELAEFIRKGKLIFKLDGAVLTADQVEELEYGASADLFAVETRLTTAEGDILTLDGRVIAVEALDVFTAQGDLLYEGATGPAPLAAGTAGDVLQSGGAAADPSWKTPGTMIDEDATDYMANALLTAQGDMVVAGAGAVPTALPVGAAGQVLSIPVAPGTDPAWDDAGNAAFVATEAVPGSIWASPPGPPVNIQNAIDRIAAFLATTAATSIP